jgi:hypothetical protein
MKKANRYRSSILSIVIFTGTLFALTYLTNPDLPAWSFMLTTLANGLCTGATLNYTLIHVLHLTPLSTHFIISSLMTTFRGFGASFGSAVGGGVFARGLSRAFRDGCAARGLVVDEDLLEQVLGSPVLVGQLQGEWHEVAKEAYVGGLNALWIFSCIVALAAVFLQAGTGWKGIGDRERDEVIENENERDEEDSVQ